ncbi:MAG: Gfo/Idh/MocA family oxidoreductase [Treponema sp.]|jgi:predicted dehydrogenase|nr:Gfo/Idh/MocA family oxidoreductase [Treponema sp.]
MKAAIIGLGDISAVHLAAIAAIPGAVLAAGCDTDERRREVLPEGTPFFIDYHEMLSAVKPDVVHICLPHYLHYPVARDTAKAGCNIFAEKPLAMNYAEGLEYAALEKTAGIKICICLQNRRNPSSEKLMEILESGESGAVTGVRGLVAWKRGKAYYDAKPWRGIMAQAGGGNMINQALHTLDLIQYFARSPIKDVRGSISQLLDYGIEVEDTACASIRFESGISGLFNGSNANSRDVPAEIEVSCEKAVFIIRYQTLYRYVEGEESILARDRPPSTGKNVYGDSHQKLIAQFYRAVETGRGEYIHPEDALPVTWLIDAIRRSSESGTTIAFENR